MQFAQMTMGHVLTVFFGAHRFNRSDLFTAQALSRAQCGFDRKRRLWLPSCRLGRVKVAGWEGSKLQVGRDKKTESLPRGPPWIRTKPLPWINKINPGKIARYRNPW